MEILRLGSTGPIVELLQSTLKRINYYSETVSGLFNEDTRNAVLNFQKNSGLLADGIVGNSTWNALFPYINGYEHYTVKQGDTLYNLARTFSTTVNRILAANPGIDVYNLRIGQRIIIPFGTIIPTDISYSYDILGINLSALNMVYPFLQISTIGNSAMCKKLSCIRIGRGPKEVFYNGAFHANEWITTPLLMKFIENFSLAYVNNSNIYGYSAIEIFNNVSIYIAPMINPDGVDLVTGAIPSESQAYNHAANIATNYPSIPFPNGWKANINGINFCNIQPQF